MAPKLEKRASVSRGYIDESGKTLERKKDTSKYVPPPKIGYEDMTLMEDMTLQGILENLKDRYQGDQIYTYTSSILCAINPFKRLACYDKSNVKAYRGKRIGAIAPHIFAIGEACYSAMIEHKLNQSVLVSGESGAGKTESTKLILQFLSARTDRESPIETMVLESIPVLESMGNAKTSRNDNSSRFGKLIEIQFDDDHYICGSKIIPYLLEKSRIVHPHKGERNYHVFYQLCDGMSKEEKEKFHIGSPKEYNYLKSSEVYSIKGMDETEELNAFRRALRLFEVSEEVETDMFKIIAAVLHLGNVNFTPGDSTKIKDDASNQHLKWACELLDIEFDAVVHGLTHREIKMRSEVIQKPLTGEQSRDMTDAYAKYLYETLFLWLVQKLNECTCAEQFTQFIGVLDIFGFEKFELNSLEQFLINLANEKLQQFFNHHIFKLEQAIYEEEKIDWTQVEFKDNQPCLDLIEQRKPPGVISILDEETKFPKATDETFIEKLHNNFAGKSDYYDKPRLKRRNFGIKHYAGLVDYDVAGWRDKNKDEVPEHLSRLVKNSANKFMALLYTEAVEGDAKLTVATLFKNQLTELMNTLGKTEPYFIRCIKPNSEKVCNKFDDQLIHDQLLFAGMLETITIRRMGYPLRYKLDDFFKRYRCICPEVEMTKGDMKKSDTALLIALGVNVPKAAQVGLTKVFMKQEVYNELEDRRNLALTSVILKMQTWWRMAYWRSRFCDQHKNSVIVQTWWRMACRRKRFVKQSGAALDIQAWYRMMKAKKQLVALKKKKEEERKKLIAKHGAEKAAQMEAAANAMTDEEKKKLQAIQDGEVEVETAEAKAAAEAEAARKAKEAKKAKMGRQKSIIMKKGELVEIPIDVEAKVTVGMGWKGGQWDMDGSCLLFRYKKHRDDVYYYKPRSTDGGVIHRGGYSGIIRIKDDTESDVEQIDVNFARVHPKTNTLLFVVTVFSNDHSFADIQEPYIRIIDHATQAEYCRYNIEQSGKETAKIMCKLFRYGYSKWRLKAVGENADGRLYKHMVKQVEPFLDPEPPKRRFKVKLHRGKLRDAKAAYKDKESRLNTFCEVRYDIDKAKSKIVKRTLEPQWKTAREVAGHGDILEVIVKHASRGFGKEIFLARIAVPLEQGINLNEAWVKLEPRDKARSRGKDSVTGEIKVSVIETTPGVTLKASTNNVSGLSVKNADDGKLLTGNTKSSKKKSKK